MGGCDDADDVHLPLICVLHHAATAVLSNAKEICAAVKRVSPDTLTVLDGVCSVGSEEIRMDDWGVDMVSSYCSGNIDFVNAR